MSNKRTHTGADTPSEEWVTNEYESYAKELIRSSEASGRKMPHNDQDKKRRLQQILAQAQEEDGAKVNVSGLDMDAAVDETSKNGSAASSAVVTDMPESSKKNRKLGNSAIKWAAVAAVFCVAVFAMSMTSQANRARFTDTISYITGDDVQVKINSGDGTMISDVTEDEARAEIEEKLKMAVPKLDYKPVDMYFVGYECYPEYEYAVMHYRSNDVELLLHISNSEDISSGNNTFEGKIIKKVKFNMNSISAEVYYASEDKSGSVGTQWVYENTYYQMISKIDKDEFVKILEKITF